MSGTVRTGRCPAIGRFVLAVVTIGVATAADAQGSNVTAVGADNSNKSTAGYTPDPITTTSLPLSGKLFFTDDKRAQLDKARREGTIIVDGDVIQRTTVLNGFVRRSDGSTVYWVNDGGKTESRYVTTPSRDLMATSGMVGAEPTFVLTGANKGAGRAADETKGNPQSNPQSKGSPDTAKKKVVRKKSSAEPAAKKPAP